MAISTVRRLAADIFNVGENKVRISPEGVQEAEGALTRADVKGLIEKGIITRLKPNGRASTRKARRRSIGHRKGTVLPAKEVWMQKVRAQRKFLAILMKAGVLKKQDKWSVYGKIKSGLFRNKRAMLLYLQDNDQVPKDYEVPKQEYKKPEKKVPVSAAQRPAAAGAPAKPGVAPTKTEKNPLKAEKAKPAAQQPVAEKNVQKGESR